jgi:large subunit ribosomal protein L10
VIKMAHVSENKKKVVEEFTELIDKYPVIGIVNMVNLPAKQVQGMRAKLRDKKTVLRMSKKRLMKIVFANSKKPHMAEMANHLEGMPALVFTTENPFKLYSELQKTKTKAAAKAGQKSPKDITVQAGPTSFSPGPVIGQLGKYGIKTGIEGGKIVIKQDSIVAKKGDIINAELAGILARLGIEPMEIGLDMSVAYEAGTVYSADVLFIDETEYSNKFATSYNESLNLAMYIAYPTGETINLLLAKVYNDSKALAISQVIFTEETTPDILKKAYLEMASLSNKLPDEALSDELKAVKKLSVEESSDDEPEKKVEQKEEKKPEDAASGLGALFG